MSNSPQLHDITCQTFQSEIDVDLTDPVPLTARKVDLFFNENSFCVTTLKNVIIFWIYFKGGKVYSCGQTQSSLDQKMVPDLQPLKDCLLFYYIFETCLYSIILLILETMVEFPKCSRVPR